MSIQPKSPEYYAKIYKNVERHLSLFSDVIENYLGDETLGDLTEYWAYKLFTSAPQGTKALKKAKGILNQKILHHQKKQQQEFRLHHLTREADREKYGKKFLDTMKSMGMMDLEEYNELLPYTTYLPEDGQADPLFERLQAYWIFPIWEKNTNMSYPNAPEYVKVGLPRSGAATFEAFLADLDQQGHDVYQYVGLTLDVIEQMKAIQKDKGDIAALQYFRDVIYQNYLTDEEFRKCTGNDKKLIKALKDEVREPLKLVMFSLESKLPPTPSEAEAKSIDISKKMQRPNKSRGCTPKRNNNNNIVASKQIYWV